MSQYSSSQFNFTDPNSSWKLTFDAIPDGSTVLDIGCSSGNFSKELIKQKGCIVDGIELNPQDAAIASKILRKVTIANIEYDELPQETYDVLFMGDVIEHLSRPIPTLARLQPLLKKGGRIVFSIPNITHMSVRLMLMKGTIEYGQTGLLDETHLHFYSQAEVFRVFNEAGYEVKSIEYVTKDVPIATIQHELEDMGLEIRSESKLGEIAHSIDGATYQFVGYVSPLDKPITHQQLPVKSPIDINDAHAKRVAQRHHETTARLQKEIAHLKDTLAVYQGIESSASYKIGRKITKPMRVLKEIKKKTRAELANTKVSSGTLEEKINDMYSLPMSTHGRKGLTKIGLVLSSIERPTSSAFVRLISPLTLPPCSESYELTYLSGEDIQLDPTVDVYLVQRTAVPDTNVAKRLIKYIKDESKVLIVDTDDGFKDMDQSHPEYELQMERAEALDLLIDAADDVWFSTNQLKLSYKRKHSTVIKNTLDARLFTKLSQKTISVPKSDQLELVYMGTATHGADFEMILSALDDLDKAFPNSFRLSVIGVTQESLEKPWLQRISPENNVYPEFSKWFSLQGPFDIGLAPLINSGFNASKSDIKCLDYLAIGAKPIVSDVRAYETKELTPYIVRVKNTKTAWVDTLTQEIEALESNRRSANKRINSGYDYVMNYRLATNAAKEIDKRIVSVIKRRGKK